MSKGDFSKNGEPKGSNYWLLSLGRPTPVGSVRQFRADTTDERVVSDKLLACMSWNNEFVAMTVVAVVVGGV